MSEERALLIVEETVRLFQGSMKIDWEEAIEQAKEFYGVK